MVEDGVPPRLFSFLTCSSNKVFRVFISNIVMIIYLALEIDLSLIVYVMVALI